MITFPALDRLPGIRAGFTGRVPCLDVQVEREEALARLALPHQQDRAEIGLSDSLFATAEQVHGCDVVRVDSKSRFPVPSADGLLTTDPGVCLGIYVADCAAVFLADRDGRGIALAHSGKKGTELGVAPAAARALCEALGESPAHLVAQISPCIRPPHYETDFAADIVRQLAEFGVRDIHDCGICTASHPDAWYSYRLEKGRTGRMLALMGLA